MDEPLEFNNLAADNIEHWQMPTEGRTELVNRKCRAVISGKTGSGKSSLANKLMGRPDKRFTNPRNAVEEAAARQSEDSFFVTSTVSGTKICQFGTTVQNGIELTVVDSPGFHDTDKKVNNQHVLTELTRGLFLVEGKPHAFIIVVGLGRVTQEDLDAVNLYTAKFGTSHVIVVFSHGETLQEDGLSIEECANLEGNDQLKAILEVVRETGRYHVMTKDPARRQAEVDLLMEKINEVSDELRKPWSNPKLHKLSEKFERKVEKFMREKNCSEYIAAIQVRNEIVKWEETKKTLLKGVAIVGLFVACGVVGVAAGAAGAAIGGAVVAAEFAGIMLGSGVGASISGASALGLGRQVHKTVKEREKLGKKPCCIL